MYPFGVARGFLFSSILSLVSRKNPTRVPTTPMIISDITNPTASAPIISIVLAYYHNALLK